jgi:hypothetical protein
MEASTMLAPRECAVALSAVGLFHAPLAAAETPKAGEAEAERFFTEGRRLMEAKKFVEACDAFDHSFKIDAALGTLLNLADCLEQTGRFASAWSAFNDAVAWAHRTGEAKREQVARERATALEPKIAHLKISAGPGVEVLRDGVAVVVPTGGVDVPVDPGTHEVRARESGRKDWTTSVEVPIGPETRVVNIPPLEPIDTPSATPPALAKQADEVIASNSKSGVPGALPETTRQPPGRGSIVPGAVTAGAGAVLAGVGIAGIAYSWSVDAAVLRQAPGGSDYGKPTVTRAQYQQLSWIYPGAIAFAAVGVLAAGCGIYFIVKPPANGSVGSEGGAITVGIGGNL